MNEYDKLVSELKDLATVYKVTGQTKTTEYRLSMQAASAIEKLSIMANNYRKALEAML